MSSGLSCPPTYATERNPDRDTLGPQVEDYQFLLTAGKRFMPHQRYIADVAHELDPETGLLWYDTVVIIIPRQNGKTTYVEAKLTHSAARGRHRQLIYAAQNADKAREKLIDEWYEQRLRNHPYFGRRIKVRKSNGSAHLRFLDTGSTIYIVPSNDSMADGKTVADGVLDEAFCYADTSVIASIQPTTLTLPDPQLTIVSTVGKGDDGLLMHYQDVGLAAIHDPDSRVAYFEWSAMPDDDLDDPAVWARIMPALGLTATDQRIRSFRSSMTHADFDRAFGNRRPTVAELAAINLEHWSRAARNRDAPLPILPPYSTAFHVTPDRSSTAIAVTGRLEDDPEGADIGVVIDERPATGWVPDEIAHQRDRGCELFAADRVAGAGGIIDRCAGRGINVEELGGTDVGSHCGTFVDELEQRTLAHGDQLALNTAVNGSRSRPLGGVFAWDQRSADVSLASLNAATWSIGNYRKHFPHGARHDRIT